MSASPRNGRFEWARRPRSGAIVLIVLVLLVGGRTLGFELLDHGDLPLLRDHPVVARGLDPTSLRWALTSVEGGTYEPLTRLSHLIDVSLFGLDARGHHAVNLLLHLVNTLLVFAVLRRATDRALASFLVAALFAVHPLSMQSLAWVSARGLLLAATATLLALDRWIAWVRGGRREDAFLAHVAFAAGLLCSPLYAPLPLVLLAFDRWPLPRGSGTTRTEGVGREKLGFFALATVAFGATVALHRKIHGLASLDEVGWDPRLRNAGAALWRTLRRTLWPDDLAAHHPFRFDVGLAEAVLGFTLVLLLGGLAWRLRARRPLGWTAWVWWMAFVMPTVQIVQYGDESTADRHLYLAAVAVWMVIVFAWPRRLSTRTSAALAVVALVVASVAGVRATAPWRDASALYAHDLRVGGETPRVLLGLSVQAEREGDLTKALSLAHRAVQLAPQSARALFREADLLYALGNFAEARRQYAMGVLIDGDDTHAYLRLGEILLRRGEVEEAGRAYHRAHRIDPQDPRALVGLADVMQALDRPLDRVSYLQEALQRDPRRVGLRREIAWIFATSSSDSLRAPASALRLAETDWIDGGRRDARSLEVLAAALAASGRRAEAERSSARAESLAIALDELDLAQAILQRRSLYLP